MHRTIFFKNGSSLSITQEVADILYKRITVGCGQFQCFWDGENGRSELIVNLEEITYIN